MGLARAIGATRREVPMNTIERHQRLVQRISAILAAHSTHAVRIGDLPRLAGISERTLRNAFHHVHGLSPKQFEMRERLQRARRALCEAVPSRTVTSIALEYGFFELGRFSAVYRRAFGESPSRTMKMHVIDDNDHSDHSGRGDVT